MSIVPVDLENHAWRNSINHLTTIIDLIDFRSINHFH